MAQAKRTPAPPPELPGFTFERHLGSGGFSDVYLYEQQLPRRKVAIKVLLGGDELGDTSRQAFIGEANVMAQMSSHPYIVTIFHADVASDGRPYFVMEYAPGRSLSDRYRTERIPVDEVLRTGVRIASAVATAHTSGVLHRDIKPANILSNAFGWPALTDFGISSAVDDDLADAVEGTAASGASAGMSVPWSSPEMFDDDPQPDVRSEVFSLGATIYTLVAGHTPFEVRGGKNGTIDLIGRIERGDITPITRPDVPRALASVLHKSMSRRPEHRYSTAVEFARALQRVELELGYAPTAIDVPSLHVDAPVRGGVDDDDPTSLRSIPVIDAQAPRTSPVGIPAGLAGPAGQAGPARGAGGPNATGPATGPDAVHGGARASAAERTETRHVLRIAAQHPDDTASRGAGPRRIDAQSPAQTRSPAQSSSPAQAPSHATSHAQAGARIQHQASANATEPTSRPSSPAIATFEEPSLPPLGGGLREAASAPVFERRRGGIELPQATGEIPLQRASGAGVASTAAPARDRARGEHADPYAEAKKPKNQNLIIGILAGVVVLLLVALSIFGWVFFPRDDQAGGGTGGNDSVVAPVPPGDFPRTPTAPTATRSETGMITFTWMNPDEQQGDVYFWKPADGSQPGTTTSDTFATVGPYPADAKVCIAVETRRAGKVSPMPLTACYPQ